MSLNKLPDGSPSPRYKCVAVSREGVEEALILTEWWYEGKKVESIEQSAESYFYDVFDKGSFTVESITKLEGE